MKRIFQIAAGAIGAAVLSFILGIVYEHGAVTSAREAQTECTTKFETAVRASVRDQGILNLYRANAELGKSNFGNGADFLGRAKTALADGKDAKLLAEVDAALDAAKKNDHSSVDHTLAAIAQVESH